MTVLFAVHVVGQSSFGTRHSPSALPNRSRRTQVLPATHVTARPNNYPFAHPHDLTSNETNNPTTMPPKKNAAASPTPTPQSNIKPSQLSSASKTPTTSTPRNANDAQQILLGIYNNYLDQTPQRVKLIDAFMAFLVVVGVLQFVYCVLAGNYVSSMPQLDYALG